MATPESYGIDIGADTEATFGTSADSMGVCFKRTGHCKRTLLAASSLGHWGVNPFPRVPNTAPWTVVNANRDPDRPLSTLRQAFDTIADAFPFVGVVGLDRRLQ